MKTNYNYLLKELLAIIHRDGGHYFTRHGLKKATYDAIDIINQERSGRANKSVDRTANGKCFNCGQLIWPDGEEFDYTP